MMAEIIDKVVFCGVVLGHVKTVRIVL
jgi:hypothetical protein